MKTSFGALGAKYVQITSMDDLTATLKVIFDNRTAAATKMNKSNSGHSGSSRSHAALILSLFQLNDGKYVKT
jgi:hypothetical protein